MWGRPYFATTQSPQPARQVRLHRIEKIRGFAMSDKHTAELIESLKQLGSKAGKLRGMLWGVLNTDVAVDLGLAGCADAFLHLAVRLLYASGLTLDKAHERLRGAWREVEAEAAER